MRTTAAAVLFASLTSTSLAPLQCGRGAPDPALRTEDSAGDALWALSRELKKQGDEAGAKKALKFLVERYPSSRHVEAAKAELGDSRAAP